MVNLPGGALPIRQGVGRGRRGERQSQGSLGGGVGVVEFEGGSLGVVGSAVAIAAPVVSAAAAMAAAAMAVRAVAANVRNTGDSSRLTLAPSWGFARQHRR